MAPVFEPIHKEVVSDTPSFEVGQSQTEVVACARRGRSSGSQGVVHGPTDGPQEPLFEFNDLNYDGKTAKCDTAGFNLDIIHNCSFSFGFAVV